MNFNPFKRVINKIGTQSGTLSSYIKSIEKSSFHQWSFKLFLIEIFPSDNSQVKTYSFKTNARHYGDFVILNEGHYYDIPEQALAAITKQVFDVSDAMENSEFLLKYNIDGVQRNAEYFKWFSNKKRWEKISSNYYYEHV